MEPFLEKCPVCGKLFEPTGEWAYKRANVRYCTWRCFRAAENYTPRRYTFNGETKSIRQWAIESGIPYSTLYNRILGGYKDPFKGKRGDER